ncbi:MAG: hypothetical protein ACRC7S_19555, partial [Cetobacterium sp.]
MEYNFLRIAKIIVDGKEFHSDNVEFQFNIDRRFSNSGNEADVRVYYISKETKNLFKKNAKIDILAGYQMGSVGLLFTGLIDEVEFNEKDGVDILCTENNKEWTNEVVNKSFKSGGSGISLKEIVKNIIENSTIKNHVIDCEDYTYTRGFNAQGTLKSELTKLSEVVGAVTYIKKNRIYFVRKNYTGSEILLTSDSGLMEIKNKNEDGYVLTTLLNHRLEEDGKITVKGRDIEFKAVIDTVSHKYDRNRFETVLEVHKEVTT